MRYFSADYRKLNFLKQIAGAFALPYMFFISAQSIRPIPAHPHGNPCETPRG